MCSAIHVCRDIYMMHEHGFVTDALAFGAYTEATEDRRKSMEKRHPVALDVLARSKSAKKGR